MLQSTIRIGVTAIAAAALAAVGAFGGVADAHAFNFTNRAADPAFHVVMTPAFNFTNGADAADFSWGAGKAGG